MFLSSERSFVPREAERRLNLISRALPHLKSAFLRKQVLTAEKRYALLCPGARVIRPRLPVLCRGERYHTYRLCAAIGRERARSLFYGHGKNEARAFLLLQNTDRSLTEGLLFTLFRQRQKR